MTERAEGKLTAPVGSPRDRSKATGNADKEQADG